MSLVITTYLAVIITIFGLAYFLYRSKRKKLLLSGIKQVDAMRGVDFERLLLENFRVRGFKANLTAEKADYGADLILNKDSIKYAVQAKRWKRTVGIEAVQQVVGAIRHYGADKGLVITNSRFTKNAKKLARSNKIDLWDRGKLINFLSETKENYNIEITVEDNKPVEKNILCQKCGENMVLRNGKNGLFYGCSRFPKCWYTQDAN